MEIEFEKSEGSGRKVLWAAGREPGVEGWNGALAKGAAVERPGERWRRNPMPSREKKGGAHGLQPVCRIFSVERDPIKSEHTLRWIAAGPYCTRLSRDVRAYLEKENRLRARKKGPFENAGTITTTLWIRGGWK
jgi:hypothetical protein